MIYYYNTYIYIHALFHGLRTYPRSLSGSLIAATDPVATLATYASLKVDPVLNVMVFGAAGTCYGKAGVARDLGAAGGGPGESYRKRIGKWWLKPQDVRIVH